MRFRSAVEADLDRILAFPIDTQVDRVTADHYRSGLDNTTYRLERTWIAQDGDRMSARAVWWCSQDSGLPLALDSISVVDSVPDPATLATDLLTAAHRVFQTQGVSELPAYHVFLPVHWRDDPVAAAAMAWRQQAAAGAGLVEELERLRYEWVPEVGLPASAGRLIFAAEADNEAFLAVFKKIAMGSLDMTTRRGVDAVGIDAQVREEMDVYLSMPGDREWWRLAYTPEGELAGLAIPSANAGGHVVGYLGVVPKMRGRGYVDDLLSEITRILVDAGARRIVADTDTTNVPMARAFERAGYRNFAIRMVLSAPRDHPG
jgi:ribosomal protein S18 acetylase RimI-like enzyme